MSIYQFAQFRFDESRGSLITLTSEESSHQNSIDNSIKSSIEASIENDEEIDLLPIQLRRKVANLLSYLIANRSRVISKEELLSELWVHGDYRENSLTQSVRELRSALGDNAKSPCFIKTYPQRGYQWIQTPTDVIDETLDKIHSVEVIEDKATNTLAANSSLNSESGSRLSNSPDEIDKSKEKIPPVITGKTPSVKKVKQVEKKSAKRLGYIALATLVIFIIGTFLWFNSLESKSLYHTEDHTFDSGVKSVLVLPFINATEKPSMGWLELGLADMLAIDLQRHDSMSTNQLHVTPPAVANALLLNAQVPWPTLPVHIRSLLREHDIEAAIFASVRLYNGQQVLDFQIIHREGDIQQGSISYPSLPAALQSISKQFLHLLNPTQQSPTARKIDNPITSQALAQGMQALQQEGPVRAIKYFQAVLLLEEDNHWAHAYRARSAFSLGQWAEAEQGLSSIPVSTLVEDPSLDAFVHYWLAEIALRRGDDDLSEDVNVALEKAEAASDAKQMARGYRLKAQVAWQENDWSTHHMWSSKAQALFPVNNELRLTAENLFYLGRPSNPGLEKSPNNNLKDNQPRLLKALNFYQQLGNQRMIAASQFAIAQNYSFDLSIRTLALQKTIALYEKLLHPYELAQALNYAGFFYMQLHDGKTAHGYFSRAKEIAQKLGAKPLMEMANFYIAFSVLDQGLDQSELGRHGKNEAKLYQAISQLEDFIANKPSAELHGSALVFLGWANTDLGNYDLALTQLAKAKVLNTALNMLTTLGYSNYSIMRIHLERGDYRAVIAMAGEEITTRLQAVFLARAYYEVGETQQAINVLKQFKINHKNLWQSEDESRLAQFKASLSGTILNLTAEPKAHLVYCESDWQP
jgi:DNA-binding winged helix-turn-helix (wHTH) protein/tetratricopeptide (TPR) repeat protein